MTTHGAVAATRRLAIEPLTINDPSKRLLARLGFLAVAEPSRPVASFDPGDTAFVWRRPKKGPPPGPPSSGLRAPRG